MDSLRPVTPSGFPPPDTIDWWLSQAFTDFQNGFVAGLPSAGGAGGTVAVVAGTLTDSTTGQASGFGVGMALTVASLNGLKYFITFHHLHPIPNWIYPLSKTMKILLLIAVSLAVVTFFNACSSTVYHSGPTVITTTKPDGTVVKEETGAKDLSSKIVLTKRHLGKVTVGKDSLNSSDSDQMKVVSDALTLAAAALKP